MGEFRMPSLGADMEKGTLLRWLVKPGDRVQHGDVIAHIETDKADVDIEVFESGTVGELLVEEGTTVPVGTPLARIDGAGAPAPSPAAAPAAVAAAPAPAPQPVAPAPPPAAPTPVPLVVSPVEPRAEPPAAPRRPRVSPLARVTAERMGVDLATVTGTGLNGAITQADVVRLRPPRTGAAETPAAAAPPPPPPTGRAADKAAAMRRAIAAAMARSHREIPAYYLAQRVEMTRALAWLEARNRDHRVADRVLPATLLLKAAALAVHDVPEMNGFWRDDAFVPSTAVHLGVGISLPGGGLIAPAIHDADQLSLDALMAALRDLVARTRAGTLRGSELTDATITVTNLGDRGVETVFGVIYPPQVALVGFGRIVERPWAEDGMLAARPQVTASLTADHRASDGHRGALYLAAIDARLQEPERL